MRQELCPTRPKFISRREQYLHAPTKVHLPYEHKLTQEHLLISQDLVCRTSSTGPSVTQCRTQSSTFYWFGFFCGGRGWGFFNKKFLILQKSMPQQKREASRPVQMCIAHRWNEVNGPRHARLGPWYHQPRVERGQTRQQPGRCPQEAADGVERGERRVTVYCVPPSWPPRLSLHEQQPVDELHASGQ